ncbi:DUF6098 family protein [Actinopolymorpha pittospori]|uniref:Uncharacterized protein n=1 Tax=Actinopolymorpha pittospori TaxID=648752 RepID=A0A927MML6_9ACTN|nr:DUF6098 family protein [Actinopolymorpha pittospori]MBE1603455.1 hypothetical protein [Actinopolymorpha pittospori]
MRVLDNLEELADLVSSQRARLYVRFSDGPEHDIHEASIDYESDLPLPGLSVNKLDPPEWWSRPLQDWLARQVCQYLHLAERSQSLRGWVLTGTMVGRGPDDEPLLADVEPFAWLGDLLLAEAQARYDEHFHRGRAQQG